MSVRNEVVDTPIPADTDQLIPEDNIKLLTKPHYFDSLGEKNCLMTWISVFLPPLFVFLRKDRCSLEVLICILLSALGLLPGTLYAFHLENIQFGHNLACLL